MRKLYPILFYLTFVPAFVLCFMQTSLMMPGGKAVDWAMTVLLILSHALACTETGLEFARSDKSPRARALFWGRIAIILISILCIVNKTYSFPLTVLVLLSISSQPCKEDGLLKTGFYIGTVIVVALFFLSMLGLVPNNRGNSFGFIYRTDYAAHLLSLAILWCIIRDGWLSWLGELAMVALAVFMGAVVGGSTDFICIVILILGTQCRHYMRIGGVPYQEGYGILVPLLFKLIYLPAIILCRIAKKLNTVKLSSALRYSFVAAALISFILTFTYQPLQAFWDWIPGLGTVKSRLFLGTIGFQEYPLMLLGNIIPEMGAGYSESGVSAYFFLDNAYVRLALKYGLAMLVIFLWLMSTVQGRLHREGRHYAVFALAVFALGSLLEFEALHFGYNLFALLAFCRLSEKPGVEACDRLRIGDSPVCKRIVYGGMSMVVAVLFGLWCFTAYRITSWRGWTPFYAATVVVPDDQDVTLLEKRLSMAKDYMSVRPDAACVVATEESRDWMIDNKVDSTRVHVVPYSGIDDMLTESYSFVQKERLNSRLAVCAPGIEQGRIARRASALHIPVNSLEVRLPLGQHLRCFASEQWRLLCGKE